MAQQNKKVFKWATEQWKQMKIEHAFTSQKDIDRYQEARRIQSGQTKESQSQKQVRFFDLPPYEAESPNQVDMSLLTRIPKKGLNENSTKQRVEQSITELCNIVRNLSDPQEGRTMACVASLPDISIVQGSAEERGVILISFSFSLYLFKPSLLAKHQKKTQDDRPKKKSTKRKRDEDEGEEEDQEVEKSTETPKLMPTEQERKKNRRF